MQCLCGKNEFTSMMLFGSEDKMYQNITAVDKLKKYSPLIRELVLRDLKVKYRHSVLGYLWSLINPLAMMCIMSLVFSYMFRFDTPNYPLYVIIGQTLWTFFFESTNNVLVHIFDNYMMFNYKIPYMHKVCG